MHLDVKNPLQQPEGLADCIGSSRKFAIGSLENACFNANARSSVQGSVGISKPTLKPVPLHRDMVGAAVLITCQRSLQTGLQSD